jgi:hypothetical protein
MMYAAPFHLRPSENVGLHEGGAGTSVCRRWLFSTFVGSNHVTATQSKDSLTKHRCMCVPRPPAAA